MHEAAAHGSMNGLDVLRELSRHRGEPVVSPIVFTSAAAAPQTRRALGDLAEVIDRSWDPPVTRGARLVSVSEDALQHVGQASYLAGMKDSAFE